MLLRQGRVVAQGPLERVVTEEALSETFAMPLRLTVEDGRYAARRRTRRVTA
jgi:iron complex transport system ATP-binding protein